MTKRFVIGTAPLTRDQEKQFIEHLRASNVAWWHWLPNFWLIKDSKEKLTARDLRDAIPGADALVMEINEDVTWAMRGTKNSSGKPPWDWLKGSWPD